MPLDNPEFTTNMSSLLEKVLQNIAHTWEVTQNGYSSGYSMWMSQYPMESSALNRSGTLLECYNLPEKNNAPHWVPNVTQGCFWDNKVSCLCSGCQFLNDRPNYQLNFMCIYWVSKLFWSSEDGLTVYHMFCTQYGLYLYGLHPV